MFSNGIKLYTTFAAVAVVVLAVSGCNDTVLPSDQSKSSSSSNVQQSSVNETSSASQDLSAPSSAANIYRYDNIPSFPISKISPQKITYYKAMLGETTVILDTDQIEQVTELLSKVEINDTPTKKEDDAELHQLISFYQNVDDKEPSYSLYFLVDSLYIETNESSSDVYPTLNWINKGLDDESKTNVQFRKLLDSWAQPGFSPLPSP